MPEIKDAVSATVAKIGDLVELGKKSYDVVNDGKAIRQTVAAPVSNVFNRSGILAKKAEAEAIVIECDAIIAEMDKAGIE